LATTDPNEISLSAGKKRAFSPKNWPSIAQESFEIKGLKDVRARRPAAEFLAGFRLPKWGGSGIRHRRQVLRY
jgi:hypothetical protein